MKRGPLSQWLSSLTSLTYLISCIPKAVKKRLWHNCFSVNLAKFLRTSFLKNTSGRLPLLSTFQEQSPEVFCEKRCSWNFAKFTGKQLWFAKFPKTLFLQNTSGRLLLVFSCKLTKVVYWQYCLENLRWIFII